MRDSDDQLALTSDLSIILQDIPLQTNFALRDLDKEHMLKITADCEDANNVCTPCHSLRGRLLISGTLAAT